MSSRPDPTDVRPESEFPASWHRAVVARIAIEVPALAIAYADAA